MPCKVAAFTHTRLRQAEFERTKADYAEHGFEVLTVPNPYDSGDPSGLRNRMNAIHTLKAFEGEGVLLIEDDTTPNELLRPMLELAVKWDECTIMCLLHNASLTKRMHEDMQRGTAEARLEPMNRVKNNGFYGSQAIYLPAWLVDGILAFELFWDTRHVRPFDVTLNQFWIEKNIIPLVAVPNPVQHRSPHTLVTRRPPRPSLLFDLIPLKSSMLPDPPNAIRTVDMNHPRPLVRFLQRHRYKGVMNGFGAIRKVDFADLELLERKGIVRKL